MKAPPMPPGVPPLQRYKSARVEQWSVTLVSQHDLETALFKKGCVAQSKDRILRKQLGTIDLLGGAEGDGLGERCNRTAEVRGSTPLGSTSDSRTAACYIALRRNSRRIVPPAPHHATVDRGNGREVAPEK